MSEYTIPDSNDENNSFEYDLDFDPFLPFDLVIKKESPPKYPIEALGSVLGSFAVAIHRIVDVPIEVASQCILSTSSLACQGYVNFRHPITGYVRPCSLFFLSIASSGSRKTSGDGFALIPVNKRKEELEKQYKEKLREWKVKVDTYKKKKNKILGDKISLTDNQIYDQLMDLGEEPLPPLYPVLTTGDATQEGLYKTLLNSHGIMGLFSAEASQVLSGYSMSRENKLKFVAFLSELWDGQVSDRIRAHDEPSILRGKRLTSHLLIQPEAVRPILEDEALKDQGFWSRWLIVCPDSMIGKRIIEEFEDKKEWRELIRIWEALILKIMRKPLPYEDDSRNVLAPRHLVLSAEARSYWVKKYNYFELMIGEGRPYHDYGDFVSKLMENATRIATVLSYTEDQETPEISLSAMRRGTILANYYLKMRIFMDHSAAPNKKLQDAQKIYDWIDKNRNGTNTIRVSEVRRGSYLAKKLTLEYVYELMTILADHGYIEGMGAEKKRKGFSTYSFYKIIAKGNQE